MAADDVPGRDGPASDEPATGEPASNEPATGKPASNEPATGKPATTLTPEVIETVRRRVARCLDALVGGSGHLAAYAMRPDSFRITSVEDLGAGRRRFAFTVEAAYESEFTVYEEDVDADVDGVAGRAAADTEIAAADTEAADDGAPTFDVPFTEPATETLEGYIALEPDLSPACDNQGRLIFGPWRTLDLPPDP